MKCLCGNEEFSEFDLIKNLDSKSSYDCYNDSNSVEINSKIIRFVFCTKCKLVYFKQDNLHNYETSFNLN